MFNKLPGIIFSLCIAIALCVAGCMSGGNDNSAMHRRIADAFLAAYNDHDVDNVARLYDENVMLIYSDSPVPRYGRSEVIGGLEAFFRAFPDIRMRYTNFMSDSTTFALEGVWQGTHSGPLSSGAGDIAPSGRRIEMRFAMFAEVNPEGLILVDRGYYNLQDFIQQLFPQGVPTAPDSGEK